MLRPGIVDYLVAWDEQRRLHDAVAAGAQPDTVLLLEHPSGLHRRQAHRAGGPAARRHAGGRRRPRRQDHLARPRPAGRLPDPQAARPGRRGRPTCAGLEQTADRRLRRLRRGRRPGRRPQRRLGPADDRGPDRKVAAIGIRVARASRMHGFALNCDCDLSPSTGSSPAASATPASRRSPPSSAARSPSPRCSRSSSATCRPVRLSGETLDLDCGANRSRPRHHKSVGNGRGVRPIEGTGVAREASPR